MSILESSWSSLGEDPGALGLVRDTGAAVPLVSVLPVARLVHDGVAAASLSAALLAARRTGSAVPTVELDPIRVATAVTSERHFRLDGQPTNPWAELSGFWPTADGWVRTHANYPHHRARLLAALELPESTTADELLIALHERESAQSETAVADAGGVAVAVRTEDGWRAHPQAMAVATHPLIRCERLADAPARVLPPTTIDAPARGVRVLDLTRVIAGPVATRTLALWGADVLRIDGPERPEIEAQHLDTGAGKRSAILDLATQRATLEELLGRADVVVLGYRSGALGAFGLSPEALVERWPGLIVARLTAWGDDGPFADRRGFDSIVQAASGIAILEGADDAPGALPAQALDHTAGYLLAAGITSALRRRIDTGGSWLVETSLARVAQELLDAPRDVAREPERSARHERTPAYSWEPSTVTFGAVTFAAPAAAYDSGPEHWPGPPVPWGSSAPRWDD
jgi:crotonobetainyl-CoA:carnitine CoA-transferase CaiB-like acyl-CoA transferase